MRTEINKISVCELSHIAALLRVELLRADRYLEGLIEEQKKSNS